MKSKERPTRRRAKPARTKLEPKLAAAQESARKNASKSRELEKRLAESLEQQTATSEILRVISSSPTDVQPVLDAVAEHSTRLCGALFASVYQFDGELIHMGANYNYPPLALERSRQFFPTRPNRQLFTARAILERAVVHVPDVERDDEYAVQDFLREVGFRSVLSVPMLRDGNPIGAITVWRAEVGPFTDRQVALLKTFADQAVIAIENVRLFKELEGRNRDLTATSEILRVISSSPTDVQPVFDAIIANAIRLCDATFGGVFRYHDGQLHVAALARLSQEETDAYHSQYPRPPHRNFIMGRAFLDGRPVHIEDILTDPDYDPQMQAGLQRVVGFRTLVAVPILRNGVPIGVVGCARREVKPFTPAQVELVKTFADQAVIAIENVRLFTELQASNRDLRVALEQQTATSEVLKVISRSTFDLQPVLETLIENATKLCDATRGNIFRFDGGVFRAGAFYGASPEFKEFRQRAELRPGRGSVVGRVGLERRTIQILDVLADPEFQQLEAQRIAGFRTVVGIPMLREGMLIGAIVLWRTEVRAFTDKQIELVTTFADQAVIAIENVRLFTELEGRNRDLTATSEILRVISSSPTDVQPVFDTIVRSAVRLCDGLFGALFQFDGELLHLVAHHNYTPEALEAAHRVFPARLSRGQGSTRAILERAVVHIPDYEVDPEYQTLGLARVIGWRSGLFVPMLRDGAPIGVIMVTRPAPGPFSDSEIELLKTFADQAVIAVENVRLFKELEASNSELTTALDTQTATSDILRVISSSPTDVQPVFDTIAASAVRLCRGLFSIVSRREGDLIHVAAQNNLSPAALEEIGRAYPMPVDKESITGRTLLNRTVNHVRDVETDPDVPGRGRGLSRAFGFRTVVSVPMLREGAAIGAIAVARAEPEPFSEQEIVLLQTFADQAVIAIENVRLFSELEGRNRDLTATSEILRVISSSPTDVQPVFDTIVRSAVRLCDGLFSALYQFDGDLIHLVAQHNWTPEALEAAHRVFPARPSWAMGTGRAILGRAVVHIPDVEVDTEYQLQALSRAIGHRSGIWVPMLREGTPIGVIVVARAEPGPFSDNEIELLKTFADQAVIAVENVRLFKELQARTGELSQSVEKLTALGEVSRAVSSTLDVETVLDTIVSRATQLAGADGCAISEYDDATAMFQVRATHGIDAALVATLRAMPLRKGEGVMGRAAETREATQIADIAVPGAYQSHVRDVLIGAGYRALLSVPLLREEEIIGSLSLVRKAPGEYPSEVIEVLKTFATQSALAIQNARLFREIADKSRQLEAASRHKSEFLANMSHELRTPLNAIIGFSEVLVDRMFGELNEKQDEYLKDIYASGQHLLSLINDILDLSKIEAGRMELEAIDFDLPSAIDNALTLVRERATRRGITLGHTIDEHLGTLRGDERKVKQVLLNLLSNALKFTPEGGRVDVSARVHDGAAEIAVADTGVGIAPEDQDAVFEEFRQVGAADKKVEGTGLGLALSRKFIELHGGRIWVKSEVGKGSTFSFTLPMN
jgi:GAF domain-containing protein